MNTDSQTQGEGAFTIDEFCRAFQMSRAMFYKLKTQGKAPSMLYAGKPLISFAAASEWRRKMEVIGVGDTKGKNGKTVWPKG